jgi:hypothetical protein
MFDLLLKVEEFMMVPACRDSPTMAVAGQRATGVHHKVVNGEVVIENGAVTGAYPGQVLRNTPPPRD